MQHGSSQSSSQSGVQLPESLASTPIRQALQPMARFMEIEAASGILLVLCLAVAMSFANSPWHTSWESFWHTEISLAVGSFELRHSLHHWINDGLMTIFFFLVGLEIKREAVSGELQSIQKAALPVVAAIGGMLVPAGVYLALQAGQDGQRGWGIPMATDIAFAVGILTLLGERVPAGLKIMLLALAIADDIGAILVIALFYSSSVHLTAIGAALLGIGLVVMMNRVGVRSIFAYILVGAGIWLAMHHSGIHPTIAGVALGLLTPASAPVARESLVELLLNAIDRLDGKIERPQHSAELAGSLSLTARETISPLERLESALHPWVAFFIMPVFALANAGVAVEPQAVTHSVAIAVAAGLIVGKPLGIFLFSWIAVRFGAASLPQGVSWKALLGAGFLAGVGFTMSLFIAGLALDEQMLVAAKIGTLAGSALSAILGLAILHAVLPRNVQAST